MLHIAIAHYDCAAIPNAPLCAADIPIPSLDVALIAVAAVAVLGLVRMSKQRSHTHAHHGPPPLVTWLRSHFGLVGATTLTMLLLAMFLDYWLG